ncbi:hypothetical protein PInf_007063 [Phytophthora infestans]|nr:hypothetical protein PInf_007063 [Phytophthora infestans]
MYGTSKDGTFSVKTTILCVGFLEDFICATYFACVLWLVDMLLQTFGAFTTDDGALGATRNDKLKRAMVKISVFSSSWMLFVLAVGPVATDFMLVRLREARFTFQALSSEENSAFDGVTSRELKDVCMTATITAVVAALFATVRAFTSWSTLSRWNPIHDIVALVEARLARKERRFQSVSTKSSSGGGEEEDDNAEIMLELDESGRNSTLNATLNELFAHALGDTSLGLSIETDGSTPWVETYIQSTTENYTLFHDDSLYRRTTGFTGDLAFDVDVTSDDPPNVLLIVVESFRFHDSRYLVGDDDPSNLFKGSNITITPNFDKWAKRGTGGKEDVELAGLPQLFKDKGYESFFTTGCQTEYDDWNSFLPSHGFDTVWSRDEMMKIAERDLNISSDDWYGEAQRGLYWGVHDDLSFQILGDLLVNKTQEQSERVAQGEDKKPLFLTHYTISSHIPFQERPKWYAEADKPDFSALYADEEYTYLVKDYLEMRYFTDMELGKFMDRMAEEGILNDTIVIISGDHGQAPEYGYDKPEVRDLSATRVAGALVAEGRLGEFVGLKLEDAAEQYDLLNTLADITGVPEGGFLQDGVGRSLKRKVEFGERVVFSNNPSHKMSVVRGNKRLQYDRHSNEVLLHDVHTDHDMTNHQFSALSREEQDKWLAWRKNGRWLNSYFAARWDNKCLLAAECSM